jgi:diguanylate cyclase (GGDEF)-like protein
MLDADYFKCINDTAGHQAGDDVLKRIADEAKGLLRVSDTVARLGGEEFILMLPSTTTSEAMAVAERLRVAIERARIDTAVGQLKATVSLGVATLSHANPTLEGLLAAADRALYDAKRAGRNCVRGRIAEPPDVAVPLEKKVSRPKTDGYPAAGPLNDNRNKQITAALKSDGIIQDS